MEHERDWVKGFRPLTLTALLQPQGSLRLPAYEAECRESLAFGAKQGLSPTAPVEAVQ